MNSQQLIFNSIIAGSFLELDSPWIAGGIITGTLGALLLDVIRSRPPKPTPKDPET